jgi:acetyl esterase/lipase
MNGTNFQKNIMKMDNMKAYNLLLILTIITIHSCGIAQENPVIDIFPEGTVLHGNLNYNNDTLPKHMLDIYLPPNAPDKVPLVVFVHGGGWFSNDKYADMGYMKKTVSEIVQKGYALASIDYRFSTQAVFPAQIRDCNRAMSFLVDNAQKYGLDTERIAVMGFSAGGHLAAMMGLSKNDNIEDFFMPNSVRSFEFKAVVDFYGPSELILFPRADDPKSPEGLLIGAAAMQRPDLAKIASPVTYVDGNDPPFLLLHGENDDVVSPRHSQLLGAWLTVNGVENEVIIVPESPHFGAMFDVDNIREKVMAFLSRHLK